MEHHYEHFWLDPKFWVAVSFVLFVVVMAYFGGGYLYGLPGRTEPII